MTTAIGVVMTEHIVAGRLEDMRLAGESVRYPQNTDEVDALNALPVGDVVDILANEIVSVINNAHIDAIGVAVPGVIRHGVVEDSPNLTQLKGMRLADELTRVLADKGVNAPVHIANDADAIAAGVAATRGQLNKLTNAADNLLGTMTGLLAQAIMPYIRQATRWLQSTENQKRVMDAFRKVLAAASSVIHTIAGALSAVAGPAQTVFRALGGLKGVIAALVGLKLAGWL